MTRFLGEGMEPDIARIIHGAFWRRIRRPHQEMRQCTANNLQLCTRVMLSSVVEAVGVESNRAGI